MITVRDASDNIVGIQEKPVSDKIAISAFKEKQAYINQQKNQNLMFTEIILLLWLIVVLLFVIIYKNKK